MGLLVQAWVFGRGVGEVAVYWSICTAGGCEVLQCSAKRCTILGAVWQAGLRESIRARSASSV